MNRIKRRRPSPAMVVALIALFAAVGGVAYAADTVGSSDVIDNSLISADLKDGAGVQGVDVVADSIDGSDVAESTLGKVPNADKLDGLDSSQFATNLWAVYGYDTPTPANPTGFALVRGHGVTAAKRIAAGRFFVRFNRDITDCAYVASPGNLTDGPSPPPSYLVSVGQRNATSTPNDVVVYVYNPGTSTPIDPGNPGAGFHLAVLC